MMAYVCTCISCARGGRWSLMRLGICGLLCMYESTIKATDTARGILLRTLRIPSLYTCIQMTKLIHCTLDESIHPSFHPPPPPFIHPSTIVMYIVCMALVVVLHNHCPCCRTRPLREKQRLQKLQVSRMLTGLAELGQSELATVLTVASVVTCSYCT